MLFSPEVLLSLFPPGPPGPPLLNPPNERLKSQGSI